MSNRSDDADGDSDPFTEYGELAEKYQEPDPEPDLEELGPEIPEAPDYSDNDVDPAVSGRFWMLVVVFNIGLFVFSLGIMIAALDGNLNLGSRLTLTGVVILAYGAYQYRKSKQVVSERLDADETETTTDGDGASSTDGDDESETDDSPSDGDDRSAPLPRGQMRTVEDDDGTRYLLLKESGESSLVQDPDTGATTHLPNDSFDVVDGESPLETATAVVHDDVRTVLTAAHDERALGLLLEIDDRGPVDVRTLTAAYDLCESDLHGLLGEFRAAGLLEETDIAGERGYDTTDRASDALATLRTD